MSTWILGALLNRRRSSGSARYIVITYAQRIHRDGNTMFVKLSINGTFRLACAVPMLALCRERLERFGLGATSERGHCLKRDIHLQDVKHAPRVSVFAGLHEAAWLSSIEATAWISQPVPRRCATRDTASRRHVRQLTVHRGVHRALDSRRAAPALECSPSHMHVTHPGMK